MTQHELLQHFPARRLKSFDGMVVTADVWDAAHDYHQQQLRYHALLQHGAGILTGLDVIASDPPDSAVFIQPGIAIDAAGRMIIVPEGQAFDLGEAHGPLYLLLSYDESQPRPDQSSAPAGDSPDVLLFVRAQYGLEALSTPPRPSSAHLELARVLRQDSRAVITNAAVAAHPAPNQIDLRFRSCAGSATPPVARIAVCYLGASAAHAHGRGADALARSLRHAGVQAWVDDAVAMSAQSDLSAYALVYVVAHGHFDLVPDEMNALYAYWQGGGTLLLETCADGDVQAAHATLVDMLASFGVTLADMPEEHAVLREPHFFAAPPPGRAARAAALQAADGIVLSTADYGCLWHGQREAGRATREDIRAAHEFGHNLVVYAVARAQARA